MKETSMHDQCQNGPWASLNRLEEFTMKNAPSFYMNGTKNIKKKTLHSKWKLDKSAILIQNSKIFTTYNIDGLKLKNPQV